MIGLLRLLFVGSLLLVLSGCGLTGLWSSEPPIVVVKKTLIKVVDTRPSKPSIDRLPTAITAAISGGGATIHTPAIEAIKQLQLGQLDPLSPYYHRAEQYLLLELQIRQLIVELSVYLNVEPSELYYSLQPIKQQLPWLPNRQRGSHIVFELLQDQLGIYARDTRLPANHLTNAKSWNITPILTLKDGKICLQLYPSPAKRSIPSKLDNRMASMASPISDFFFYDYLDGIRQQLY